MRGLGLRSQGGVQGTTKGHLSLCQYLYVYQVMRGSRGFTGVEGDQRGGEVPGLGNGWRWRRGSVQVTPPPRGIKNTKNSSVTG